MADKKPKSVAEAMEEIMRNLEGDTITYDELMKELLQKTKDENENK